MAPAREKSYYVKAPITMVEVVLADKSYTNNLVTPAKIIKIKTGEAYSTLEVNDQTILDDFVVRGILTGAATDIFGSQPQ